MKSTIHTKIRANNFGSRPAILRETAGQRYELCRSVHAEANAIISASRQELIGSDLYLACHNTKSGLIDGDIEPCMMCKRHIINAGIQRVIVRLDRDEYKITNVSDWLDTDMVGEHY